MLKKIFTSPYPYILFLTYYGVWLCWDSIKLPFHNPGDIISLVTQISYNPSNNIVRFGMAIFLPPLACLALWWLQRRNVADLQARRWVRIAFTGSVIAGALLLAVAMGIVQNSTNPKLNPDQAYGGPSSYSQLDTFHEGETLGPAISYQDPDLKPYRDFIIVHGVFQDPLRSVIAFKLFGQSIGAARTMQVILGILAFTAYLALLLVLFRGNLFKSVLGLCMLAALMLPTSTLPVLGGWIYGVQFPFRDIATILFLIAAIIGIRSARDKAGKGLVISSLVVGFIAVAGFANSIDRAIYVAALSTAWLVLVAVILKHRQDFFRSTLLPYGIGLVIAIPVLGLALKWAFTDFISYVLTISKSKEFLDGIVFARPNIAVGIILVAVSIVITLAGAYVLGVISSHPELSRKSFAARLKSLLALITPAIRQHAVAILLFLTAAIFLRSAIGRALPDHFIYSVQWLYLFIAYLGINYIFRRLRNYQVALGFIAVLLLGAFLVFYGSAVKRIDIGADTFPVHIADEKFMRTDHAETARFLKKNLKSDEQFVTMTSEAAWYYFADKPSPIKYPVIWYAFTKPERQYIADKLASGDKIKYIVLNNNWTTNFDYVPNEQRFPEAYKVLHEKYVPYKGFGQQTVWIRKDFK